MKKQLTHIKPLRAGIILAILHGILSLFFIPFFILAAILPHKTYPHDPAFFIGLAFPVLYAAVGFIGGIIAAALYNLVAKWTGGFEFEVRDVPPVA